MMKAATFLLLCASIVLCKGYSWQQLNPNGNPPSPRFDFSYAFDATNSVLIVFGGSNATSVFNDLFIYNTALNTWTQVPQSGASWPAARQDAGAGFVGGLFYIAGGTDGITIFDDMWTYSYTGGWMQVGNFANMQRTGGSIASITGENELAAFGGSTPAANISNDLLTYTPGDSAWAVQDDSNIPSGRKWSPLVYSPASVGLVVFGGYNGAHLNDLWILHPGTSRWFGVKPGSTWPTGRSGHAMAYNSANKEVLLFGGEDDSGEGISDIWSLNHAATPSWTEGSTSGDAIIPGRFGHSLVETRKGQMLVFGGRSGSTPNDVNFNDLWTLSFAASGVSSVTASLGLVFFAAVSLLAL